MPANVRQKALATSGLATPRLFISFAQAEIEKNLGAEGVVEAAAVVSMFNVADRVADATGIPIDEGMTHDMRYAVGSELGMDHFAPEMRAAR